jgi:hypothetical protein
MLKKVLCGTLAFGLAAFLSLPVRAVALPQESGPTSMQQHQLELVKKSSKKKKKGHHSQKPKPTVSPQQSSSQGQRQAAA